MRDASNERMIGRGRRGALIKTSTGVEARGRGNGMRNIDSIHSMMVDTPYDVLIRRLTRLTCVWLLYQ